MTRLLSTVAALALVFVAGKANAGSVNGTIEWIDAMSHSITLEDGSTYLLAESVQMADLQPGLDVNVTYEMDDNGRAIATQVAPDDGRDDEPTDQSD